MKSGSEGKRKLALPLRWNDVSTSRIGGMPRAESSAAPCSFGGAWPDAIADGVIDAAATRIEAKRRSSIDGTLYRMNTRHKVSPQGWRVLIPDHASSLLI